MRHLTWTASARNSRPGRVQPGDVASRPRPVPHRPHPRTRSLSEPCPGPAAPAPRAFVRSRVRHAAPAPRASVRTVPKPSPDRADPPAPAAPPAPSEARPPGAFVRSHPVAPADHPRTRPIAPVVLDRPHLSDHAPACVLRRRGRANCRGDTHPVAPSIGLRDCPNAPSARAARRLGTVRLRGRGQAPTRPGPMTPPSARAARRPRLRPPGRPCPLAP